MDYHKQRAEETQRLLYLKVKGGGIITATGYQNRRTGELKGRVKRHGMPATVPTRDPEKITYLLHRLLDRI